ncbi:MAG: hypothetical protein U0174_20185 [Polyangiaceae bacterium]
MTLLSPGELPRQAIRYRGSKGASVTFDLDVGSAAQNLDPRIGMLPRQPGLTMRYTLTATRVDVANSTDLRVEFEVLAAALAPESEGRKNTQVAELVVRDSQRAVHRRGAYVCGPMGERRPKPLPPPDATARDMDRIERELAYLTVHFPTDAVGKGARWETEELVRFQDYETVERRTYTLVGLDDHVAHVTFETTQRGEAQTLDMPGAAGTKIKLLPGSGDGKGDVTHPVGGLIGAGRHDVTLKLSGTSVASGGKTEPVASTLEYNARVVLRDRK